MIGPDQTNVGNAFSNSANSIVITTANAVAAGGFIAILIGWFAASTTISSITGGGLTWSVDSQFSDATVSGKAVATAYCPAGLAAGSTITINITSTTAVFALASSFTGVQTSSPLDVAGAGDHKATASTSWATDAVSVQAGSLVFGGAMTWATNTAATTTTGTQLQSLDGGAGSWEGVSAYQVAGAGGSYNLAGTWGGSFADDQISAAYLAAVSDVGRPPRRMPLGV